MAQEFATVWTARQRQTVPAWLRSSRSPKTQRRVSVFYLYVWDDDFGPGFIKICSYFPYPIKVWVNGHEWAKRQATKAGIGFTELSNGFASCDDPARLQAICDRLGPRTIQVFFERWTSRATAAIDPGRPSGRVLVGPDHAPGRASRTIVLDAPRHARAFFEALVADNLDLGRPENVELIFKRNPGGRKAAGVFKTAIDRHTDGVTVNVFYKHSRVKQYLKDGRAMRVETVINDAYDIGCQRLLPNLDEVQTRSRAIKQRLLDTERAGQGTILASPAFERIAQPTVTDEGRKAPALRFGDPRVQSLAGALPNLLFAACGITNKSLRAQMTALLGTTYSMNQASYDLARLRLNSLINRAPATTDTPSHSTANSSPSSTPRSTTGSERPLLEHPRPTPRPTRTTRRPAHHRTRHRPTPRPRPDPPGSLTRRQTHDNRWNPATKGSLGVPGEDTVDEAHRLGLEVDRGVPKPVQLEAVHERQDLDREPVGIEGATATPPGEAGRGSRPVVDGSTRVPDAQDPTPHCSIRHRAERSRGVRGCACSAP